MLIIGHRMGCDAEYLGVLGRVLAEGVLRGSRNGRVHSLFGERLVLDVRKDGFPLLSTKRVFWRGVVEELLWFLRGDVDARDLQEKNVHIWDGNASRSFLDSRGLHDYEEGELGPVYGWQWRRFNAPYVAKQRVPDLDSAGFPDQILYVIETLMTEPTSRRAFMSAWNPSQLAQMALPPCHVSYQFYVHEEDRSLSCQMYARSQDLCCGTPFNMASTALLATIIACALNLEGGVSRVILVMGDAHVYEQHVPGAREQIDRLAHASSTTVKTTVKITKEPPKPDASAKERLDWIVSLVASDIELDGYHPMPAIRFDMVA